MQVSTSRTSRRRTSNTGLGSLTNLLGSHLGVEVEGHEPLDVWGNTLQLGLVRDDILSLSKRGHEVGLYVRRALVEVE